MGENESHDWMDAYSGQHLFDPDLIWVCYSRVNLLFDLWPLLAGRLGHSEG